MEKACMGIVHKVEEGDSLYTISKKYGIRLIEILKANPYVNVYNLQIGDEICVPTKKIIDEEGRYYVAAKEDTIEKVMKNTGSNISTLFEVNSNLYDLIIPEGTVIRIPENKPKNTK